MNDNKMLNNSKYNKLKYWIFENVKKLKHQRKGDNFTSG